MPEGPEVWILSQAINKFKNDSITYSHGKHLIIKDCMEGDAIYFDWSFGLTGKVKIDSDGYITKLNIGIIYGEQDMSRSEEELIKWLGISWMHSNLEDIQQIVTKWVESKRVLGSLLLDQSLISGIGVAWGSEILFNSGLKPDVKACDQDLNKLSENIIAIRDQIKSLYSTTLEKTIDIKDFINSWFNNLYKIREMKIYKKGSQVKGGGRTWWV